MSWWNLFRIKSGVSVKKEKDSEVKYLIVGLGNVGPDYEGTRHNVGFEAVDTLAKELELTWKPDRFGEVAGGKYRGRMLHLLKPDTYMNLSGRAVSFWLKKLALPQSQLLIITDDLNLPLGKVRLKGQGSNGGHNGLRSIETELGNSNYPRIRVGIGRDFSAGRQVDYVLGKWADDESELLPAILHEVSNAAKAFTHQESGRIMSRLNGLDLSKPTTPET